MPAPFSINNISIKNKTNMETQDIKQFKQLKEKDIVNVSLPTGNITCTVVAIDEKNKRVEVVDAEDKQHNVPENMITTIL